MISMYVIVCMYSNYSIVCIVTMYGIVPNMLLTVLFFPHCSFILMNIQWFSVELFWIKGENIELFIIIYSQSIYI